MTKPVFHGLKAEILPEDHDARSWRVCVKVSYWDKHGPFTSTCEDGLIPTARQAAEDVAAKIAEIIQERLK